MDGKTNSERKAKFTRLFSLDPLGPLFFLNPSSGLGGGIITGIIIGAVMIVLFGVFEIGR